MSQEIDRQVVRALVEVTVFLEFSDEQAINPDAAVQVFEQLASTLQKMESKNKSSLRSQFQKIAMEYMAAQAEFVQDLGEALGLIED
ncbi:hypothetical protein [Bordetella sp. LUAb4]|uniref:hypothetical protein n=1 Tax=Bordetella sp. LUAb4 TaxID=2843195 RepID=UPI001E4C3852|nr:hypothetical protein [Bordetella sp. LUAb4]